jgi:hypothetical protein
VPHDFILSKLNSVHVKIDLPNCMIYHKYFVHTSFLNHFVNSRWKILGCYYIFCSLRFNVLIAVKIHIIAFSFMILCNFTSRYQHFLRTYCYPPTRLHSIITQKTTVFIFCCVFFFLCKNHPTIFSTFLNL